MSESSPAEVGSEGRNVQQLLANANSNRFQYGIIYSNFCIWGDGKIFFVPPPKLWTRFTPLTLIPLLLTYLLTVGIHRDTVTG